MPGMEAGEAYVTIIPSLKGFGQSLNQQVGQQAATVGQAGGDSWARGFGQKALATLGALGLGVSAAKIVGTGWSTAMNNEVQNIKFATLFKGETEKAKGFITDLKDFAAATPFDFPGLSDAAGRFLAVGIEADKVIPIMTTLGDTTALMGTGAVGIDRATTALIQMQQKGKVTGEEMMQLTEAGIPAWEALADATGLSVDELQQLSQKGKLGREELDLLFESLATGGGPALEQFAGGMEAISTTFTGQWSTLKDTAGQLLGDLFTPLLAAGTVALTWINEDLGPALTGVGDWIQDWQTPITIVATVITAVFLPALAIMGTRALINAAKVAASWVMQTTSALGSMAVQAVVFAAIGIQYVRLGIQAMLSAARVVAAWLMQKASIVVTLALYAAAFAFIIAEWIFSAATAMASAVIMAAAWFIGLGPIAWVIAAIMAVVGVFVLLWNHCEAFRDFWIQLWNVIVDAATAAWEWIKAAIDTFFGWVQTIVSTYLAIFVGFWTGIYHAAQAAWDLIRNAVKAVLDWISSAIDTVKSTVIGVWTAIRTSAESAWNAIRTKISSVISSVIGYVTDLPGQIKKALSGAAQWLVQTGKDMINGLLNGAASILSGIHDWVKRNLFDPIVGSVKSMFGISSPSRVMAQLGLQLSAGMAAGIRDGAGDVDAQLRALTAPLAGATHAIGFETTPTAAAAQHFFLQVKIGERDITDIVDARMVSDEAVTAAALAGGRAIGGGL